MNDTPEPHPDNVVPREMLDRARAAKQGNAKPEVLPPSKRRKGRPPRRGDASSPQIGRYAHRQGSERGIMVATAATFGLLQNVIAVAQMLTPMQMAHLLLIVADMVESGLPANDLTVAEAASRVVSAGLGRTIVVVDPDEC